MESKLDFREPSLGHLTFDYSIWKKKRHFKNSFRFTRKLSRKYREFPYIP